jgi:hypothetical protein
MPSLHRRRVAHDPTRHGYRHHLNAPRRLLCADRAHNLAGICDRNPVISSTERQAERQRRELQLLSRHDYLHIHGAVPGNLELPSIRWLRLWSERDARKEDHDLLDPLSGDSDNDDLASREVRQGLQLTHRDNQAADRPDIELGGLRADLEFASVPAGSLQLWFLAVLALRPF